MDRVLVLGEQRSTADLAATAFECQGVEVTRIERLAEVTATLSDKPYLLVILCLAKSESVDLKDLPYLVTASPDTPIVPASFTLSLEMALATIRLGAFDWLILPPTIEAVGDLLVRARLHRQNMILRRLAAITQLSSWFAHEVRNPLSGILNSAQLLIGGSASSDLLQRYLTLIVQEGERLERFLRRVTELGRPHRGPLFPDSLNAVAKRALTHAEPQLTRQRIQLKRGFDSRLPESGWTWRKVEAAVLSPDCQCRSSDADRRYHGGSDSLSAQLGDDRAGGDRYRS